jgi:hypothetical protein
VEFLCRPLAWLSLSVCFWAGVPAWAEVVGKVTNVTQGATVTQFEVTKRLALKADISTGDLLKTDAVGQLQIAFVDRTRIVVGPSSELLIEDITLSGGKRASQFAIQALGGTFRFLSGRSAKTAYKIRTPTATMGIRGTEFDFSIDNRRLTNLVTFSGQVRICTRNNRCARVSGGCAVVTATRRTIKQPRDDEAKISLLRENFPFVVSQETLDQSYRVQVEGCGEVGAKVVTQKPATDTDTERKGESSDREAPDREESSGETRSSGSSYNEASDEF